MTSWFLQGKSPSKSPLPHICSAALGHTVLLGIISRICHTRSSFFPLSLLFKSYCLCEVFPKWPKHNCFLHLGLYLYLSFVFHLPPSLPSFRPPFPTYLLIISPHPNWILFKDKCLNQQFRVWSRYHPHPPTNHGRKVPKVKTIFITTQRCYLPFHSPLLRVEHGFPEAAWRTMKSAPGTSTCVLFWFQSFCFNFRYS